jgi:hypothetical protein
LVRAFLLSFRLFGFQDGFPPRGEGVVFCLFSAAPRRVVEHESPDDHEEYGHQKQRHEAPHSMQSLLTRISFSLSRL